MWEVKGPREPGFPYPKKKKNQIYIIRNILNSVKSNVLFDNIEITTNQNVDRFSRWLPRVWRQS